MYIQGHTLYNVCVVHGQKHTVHCTMYIYTAKTCPVQCTINIHGQKHTVQCTYTARNTLYVQCTYTARNTMYVQCTYTARNSGVRTVITLLIFRQLGLCTNLRLTGTNKHFRTHTNIQTNHPLKLNTPEKFSRRWTLVACTERTHAVYIRMDVGY